MPRCGAAQGSRQITNDTLNKYWKQYKAYYV